MEISPEVYQMLIKSGTDIGSAQDKIAYQQKLAELIMAMEAPKPGAYSASNGGTIVANPGIVAPIAKVASTAAQGYGSYQQAEQQKRVREVMGSQNQLVLAELLRQRQGSATSTPMNGGM